MSSAEEFVTPKKRPPPKTKAKKPPTKRRAPKTKKSEMIAAHFLSEHSASDGVDPDHLQMALALSRSLIEQQGGAAAESSGGETAQQKKDAVKRMFENFGLKPPSNGFFGQHRSRQKFKWSRKCTALTRRVPAQEQTKFQRRVKQMLSSCCDEDRLPVSGSASDQPSFSIASGLLSRYYVPERVLFRLNSDTDLAELEHFYAYNLFEVSRVPCGFLLKDWRLIPGRDLSPVPPELAADTNAIQPMECGKIPVLDNFEENEDKSGETLLLDNLVEEETEEKPTLDKFEEEESDKIPVVDNVNEELTESLLNCEWNFAPEIGNESNKEEIPIDNIIPSSKIEPTVRRSNLFLRSPSPDMFAVDDDSADEHRILAAETPDSDAATHIPPSGSLSCASTVFSSSKTIYATNSSESNEEAEPENVIDLQESRRRAEEERLIQMYSSGAIENSAATATIVLSSSAGSCDEDASSAGRIDSFVRLSQGRGVYWCMNNLRMMKVSVL